MAVASGGVRAKVGFDRNVPIVLYHGVGAFTEPGAVDVRSGHDVVRHGGCAA